MKVYRIARDEGRQIGFDLLYINRAGLHFTHPSFAKWGSEKIFEANLATCKSLAAKIGDCFILAPGNVRVEV